MQQELLQNEMNAILGDDLKPEEIDDPQFKEIINGIQEKTQASVKSAEEQKKALEIKEEKVLGFDLEKAKQMSEKDDTYLWEDSPMKGYKFEKGDNIEFFSKSNKESTKATVEEDLGERIKVKTEKAEIEINKLVVISSEKFKEKEDKEKEEKSGSAGDEEVSV
jgi:hypothetical protein